MALQANEGLNPLAMCHHVSLIEDHRSICVLCEQLSCFPLSINILVFVGILYCELSFFIDKVYKTSFMMSGILLVIFWEFFLHLVNS